MLTEKISKSFYLVVILLAYSAIAALYPSLNRIALYIALPAAFGLTVYNSNDPKNSIKIYSGYLYSLYIFIAISVIYAQYQDVAMQHMHALLGVILLMVIIIRQANSLRKIAFLYIVYLFLYVAMWYYIQTEIMSTIVFGLERVDDDQLNANTIAYYTFYTTFAIFAIGDIVEKPILKKASRILFLCTIPLTIYVAIATASRQVLIIQIPLQLLLLYLRYYKSASSRTRFLMVSITALIVMVSSAYVVSVFSDSYLLERAQNEAIEDDPRTLLLKDAFNVGMDHFFTGVGAGNYICYSYSKHFSHCTYTELFANNGIFGFLMYAIMLIKFLSTQVKRYKKYKDDKFLIFAVFAFIFILDNIFYVFYPFLWLMGFLVLVMSHSEVYFKNKYLNCGCDECI